VTRPSIDLEFWISDVYYFLKRF